ncbi:YbaB/EbfC family nucleoid-associated protein [Rhodococcus phenolicus]|uniref:YbaB/EbfC family nucleoid-associated protein n=1 Tax=Rhodococcus phenolicus TaxID=263849 RepID=UPI00082C8276|nr:YbaB/EbfC family nucleoid-associated protein [Rhodococcus phenolicus]
MSAHRVDEVVERARERLGMLEDVMVGLGDVSAEATSADGRVRVHVDGGGAMIALHLAESTCRLDAAEVSATILATAHEAARTAAAKRDRLLSELRDSFR